VGAVAIADDDVGASRPISSTESSKSAVRRLRMSGAIAAMAAATGSSAVARARADVVSAVVSVTAVLGVERRSASTLTAVRCT
jgi:hypothetical protein